MYAPFVSVKKAIIPSKLRLFIIKTVVDKAIPARERQLITRYNLRLH